MKLSRLILIVGLTILSGVSMSAKENSPSYNYSRAVDELEQGNSRAALEYLNKEVAEFAYSLYHENT